MKKLMVAFCSLVLILGLAGSASALKLANVNGDWVAGGTVGGVDINYPSNVFVAYGNGSENQVRWGVPFDGPQFPNPDGLQSGLGFTGSVGNGVGPLTFGLDEEFQIGQLQHYNWTQHLGTSASAAQLQLSMVFAVPLITSIHTFTFDIEETPNWPGAPASDDHITFPEAYSAETYAYNGHDYKLQLTGFRNDFGEPLPDFTSPEQGTNHAFLWGKITEVPEPASILLLGFSLLGLMGFTRKSSRKS